MESLDPIDPEKRSWTAITFVVLWLSIEIQPFGLIGGSALLDLGLTWKEVVGCTITSCLILLGPLCLNGIAGCKYGISFPVLCRSSFGYRGAVIAALSRGVIAIGWLSLQMWVGSQVLHASAVALFPHLATSHRLTPDLTTSQLCFFLFYMLLHALCVLVGLSSLDRLMKAAVVVQCVSLLALLTWSLTVAPVQVLLETADSLNAAPEGTSRALLFVTAVTADISKWSTLALNIADLSRYSVSPRALVVGQAASFPFINIIVPFVGVLITGAGKVQYGSNSWDFVSLFSRWPAGAAAVGSLCLGTATLVTNLVANIVSPANDLANVAPHRLTYRGGALLSIAAALLIQPWAIFAESSTYITKFLVGYSMFTGAILSVMLADYYGLRAGVLGLRHLYTADPSSPYWYFRGYNWRSLAAIVAGTAPSLPGFVRRLTLPESATGSARSVWSVLYGLDWLVAVVVSGPVYILLSRLYPPARPQPSRKFPGGSPLPSDGEDERDECISIAGRVSCESERRAMDDMIDLLEASKDDL